MKIRKNKSLIALLMLSATLVGINAMETGASDATGGDASAGLPIYILGQRPPANAVQLIRDARAVQEAKMEQLLEIGGFALEIKKALELAVSNDKFVLPKGVKLVDGKLPWTDFVSVMMSAIGFKEWEPLVDEYMRDEQLFGARLREITNG